MRRPSAAPLPRWRSADVGASIPVVALVGRPNVGKSTLFNRLTRSRDALVADIPGLTRDRHYGRCTVGDRRLVLIDTGGFEPVAASGVAAQMARQTRQAIIEADLVLFIVDGRHGMTPRDQDIANELRRSARLVRVAVNKSEGMQRAAVTAEFHALGLGEPMAISSSHGDGVVETIDDCLDAIVAQRRAEGLEAEPVAASAEPQCDADPTAPDAVDGAGAGGRRPAARRCRAARSAWPSSAGPTAASRR